MISGLSPISESGLQDGLGQLVDAELLYQRGRPPRAKYIFKHALIQDAAYQSLLKRTRQQFHQRVAELLEERFQETVDAQPELVAYHFGEAGDVGRAVHYWHKAGEQARAKSAHLEAISYLERGIEMLDELADDETRVRQELAMQVSLGHANIVVNGHAALGAERAYARALVLCEELGDVPELAPTLIGLWRFHVVARPLDETEDIARRLLRLEEGTEVTEIQVAGHYAMGFTSLCMGKLGDARINLEEGIALYLASQRSAEVYHLGGEAGVICRAYLAQTEWLLGFPERAQRNIQESVALAEKLDDPFTLARALCFTGAIISEVCGRDTDTFVERGLDLATQKGFSFWVDHGRVHQMNANFKNHLSDSALDELRHSVDARHKTGAHSTTPYYRTLLARACQQAGRIDEGLRVLEEAKEGVEARGERWWESEVQRLTGELLLSQSIENAADAERCFVQAIDISRNQEAKSLELRAAMSLARLWQRQGKGREARPLLGDCYGWFTEGFETADLGAAKALIDDLTVNRVA
jgi:predicted ATPase